MRWASRTAVFATLLVIVAVAACSGGVASSPSPLKFSTASSAVVHAKLSADIPVRVSDPEATISESGPMPPGMSFRGGTSGTAAFVGVPGGDSGGYYDVRLTAVDESQRTNQEFTLSVNEKPYFPTINSTTFGANEGHGNQDMIFATGYPMPQLSYSGTLPGGFSFTHTGIGVVTISGSPGSFEGPCSSQITVLASSVSGTAALPLTIKLGDWRCFYNVVGSWVVKLGGVVLGPVGEPIVRWLYENGKKAAAWVWERGRAVVLSPQAEAAEEDAGNDA